VCVCVCVCVCVHACVCFMRWRVKKFLHCRMKLSHLVLAVNTSWILWESINRWHWFLDTHLTSWSVAVQKFYTDDSVNNKVTFYCCHLLQCTVHINKFYIQVPAFVTLFVPFKTDIFAICIKPDLGSCSSGIWHHITGWLVPEYLRQCSKDETTTLSQTVGHQSHNDSSISWLDRDFNCTTVKA
jgi:hypothetical protein